VALAFGLGLLWMFLTGVQTKLLVKTRLELLLFAWAFVTSAVWGYLVRVVVLDASVIVPYAVGTAVGALLARRIGKWWT
jgi:uncharacterized membrane protein